MTRLFPIASASGIGLTFAIAFILLASNFTVISAQQQEQGQARGSQSVELESRTTTGAAATTFQSANDSFSILVPDGWIAYDINNSTSALSEETTLGYGLIAQLCPQEEQQQGAETFSTTAGGSTNNNICQGAQEEVVHIVRYPDLDSRLLAHNITTANNNMTIIDNIVSYQLQKLQEAGYRSMRIIASTDRAVNLTNPQTNETIATLPAKLVEITYGTNTAANEIRRGYLVSTATNSTTPNLGTTKGYALFYESNSTTTVNAAAAIMNMSGSLPLPTPIQQLFDSFELIVAPELAPTPLRQVAQPPEFTAEDPTDDGDGAEDENDDNNGAGNDGEEDNSGGDDEDARDDEGNNDEDDNNGAGNDGEEDNDCVNMGGTSCDDDYGGDSDDAGDDEGNNDEDDNNGGGNDGEEDNDCVNMGGTSCDDDYG